MPNFFVELRFHKYAKHQLKGLIREVATKFRVRGFSPRRLRDAFSVHAMKLNDSGDGLRLPQEHLGHASYNTTAKYRKVANEEHRRWYDILWSETG